MTKKQAIKLFNEQRVRTAWDDEEEKWYFSVVDVVAILTDSVEPRKYWNKLKQRLKEEGNETVTNCHQLKMLAASSFGLFRQLDKPAAEVHRDTLGPDRPMESAQREGRAGVCHAHGHHL